MYVKVDRVLTRELLEYLKVQRRELLNTDDDHTGFYLVAPGILYIDETLDNDVAGQLDKAMVHYVVPVNGEHHTVLLSWERGQAMLCEAQMQEKDTTTPS